MTLGCYDQKPMTNLYFPHFLLSIKTEKKLLKVNGYRFYMKILSYMEKTYTAMSVENAANCKIET